MNDDTAQVVADLKAARDELLDRGWCRGDFVDHLGQVCAIGAVRYAVEPQWKANTSLLFEDETERRIERATSALEEHLPRWDEARRCGKGTCNHVDCFNDRKAADANDVLNLFDKALADLGGLA